MPMDRLKLQDTLGLLTFLKDAVPSHKLSDSQAALAALDHPHLDWGELDATFDLLRDKPYSTVAEQMASQLGRLVQQAGLPSLATGLFAYAGHLLLRLSGERGMERVRCIETVLELVGKVATLHNVPAPSPAVAEVSVAAVNLGTALARDVELHHADTVPAVTVMAFLAQLTHAATKVGNDLRDGKEVPERVVPWAAAAMSCSYLLALQFGDNPCPKTRAAVWKELVPAAFLLMQMCSRCSNLPSCAEWQSLVRPAVLLACAPRLLLGQLGVEQAENDALRPLDRPEVMQGLVPLLRLLSRWYHPHVDKEEEEEGNGCSSSCSSGDEARDSSEGGSGSRAAADVAGSSGSGSGEGKGSGVAATGASSSGGGNTGVGRDGSEAATDEANGCSDVCGGSKAGTEGESKGKGKASQKVGSGSASAASQMAELAVTEQLLKQQVGRALSDTLISLRLLLRNGLGTAFFVQADGVGMGLAHIAGYTQYLREWKQRQQQEEQQAQQRQHQRTAEAPAEAGHGSSGGVGQGPPGDDPAHQILATMADCLSLAFVVEEAHTSFIQRQGFRRLLDCLNETPPTPELVKQAEAGRPGAWVIKRVLLRLMVALLTGRDYCKAAFAASDGGFQSIWRCISPLGLSQEEEERLASSNPGLVRGVLGNALAVLMYHATESYEDKNKALSEERCKQLAGWLEAVTTLPELLALLKWQPRGYDSVQETLQGEGSLAAIMHLHTGLLAVACQWLCSSPTQLELLASNPSLRAPFLEVLRLPEEHRMNNNHPPILDVLTLLVKAHPSCVPELLEGGLMHDLLLQLLYWFRNVALWEADLQATLRSGRCPCGSAFCTAPGRARERHVIGNYSTTVARQSFVISHFTKLLEAMESGCHKATMLESIAKLQQPREQLTQLLRKSGKFTDASLQKDSRYVMNLLRLAGQAKAATGNATDADAVPLTSTDERTLPKAAADMLTAGSQGKQKVPMKKRQKGKPKAQGERERQEREERERAEREGKARAEEEEQQHQQERQAAAGPGQHSKASKRKKRKKSKGAAAVMSQQPVAGSSSQGEPTMPAAPDTPTAVDPALAAVLRSALDGQQLQDLGVAADG